MCVTWRHANIVAMALTPEDKLNSATLYLFQTDKYNSKVFDPVLNEPYLALA